MTSTLDPDQPSERPRLVVQATNNKPRKRARRTRTHLYEPCPGQLSFSDLPTSEDQP